MEDNKVEQNIIKIRKFLRSIEKSFSEASHCSSCKESCGDIFFNGYSKILESLDEIQMQMENCDDKEIKKAFLQYHQEANDN